MDKPIITMSQLKKRQKRYEIVKIIKRHSDGASDVQKVAEIVNELGLFSLMCLKELSLGELLEIYNYLIVKYEGGTLPPSC